MRHSFLGKRPTISDIYAHKRRCQCIQHDICIDHGRVKEDGFIIQNIFTIISIFFILILKRSLGAMVARWFSVLCLFTKGTPLTPFIPYAYSNVLQVVGSSPMDFGLVSFDKSSFFAPFCKCVYYLSTLTDMSFPFCSYLFY
jgi:hypothetical protein